MDSKQPGPSQAPQPRTPSKLLNMESASPSHVNQTPDVGLVNNINGSAKKYNTPPAIGAEVVTPKSSRNRGQLRVASLGVSPSVGRGLGSPSPGFGAGLRNIPPPITTQPQAEDVREPLPSMQLPGINETLRGLAPGNANTNSIGHSVLRPNSVLQAPAQENGQKASNVQSNAHLRDDPFAINPYARRADAIGPSHRIPGIVHLGGLLTPPGWSTGDDPISEHEARMLYNDSRLQARRTLEIGTSETKNLPDADQDKRSAERETQWNSQHKLDELLFLERAKIYKKWQDFKQKQSQQVNAQQQRPSEMNTLGRPQPLQPPTETSMQSFQRYQQSQIPASPNSYAPSPPLSGGFPHNRVQQLQQGLHFPLRSPMSPSVLDPGLVPQTVESVWNYYHYNRNTLMHWNVENERFLTMWLTRFGVPRPQGPIGPGIIPPITGQRAEPFAAVHYGYLQQEQHPWPPTQANPRPMAGYPGAGQVRTTNSHPAKGHMPAPGRSNLPQGYGTPLRVSKRDGLDRQPGTRAGSPVRKVRKIDTPQSKKRGRKPKFEKGKSWYHEQVTEANLPTSVISQEALKAGMNFKPIGGENHAPSQQSDRRSKGHIDLTQGFAVSSKGAEALIAKGAADATSGPAPGNISVVNTSHYPASTTIATNPRNGSSKDRKEACSARVVSYCLLPVSSHTDISGAAQREDSTVSAPSSAASGPSSDTPDDPKDATFGRRGQRKPGTTTPRKTATPRKAATTTKRRKSDVATPVKKRTRLSLDGQADE